MISPSIRAVFYKVISSLASLLFVWAVAFYLSVQSAGVVLYFYTMIMVVVQFSRAGTEYGVIKKSALTETEDNASMFLYVLLIVSCLAVVISLLYAAIAYFQGLYSLGDSSFWCLVFLLLGAVFFSLNQILATCYQLSRYIFMQYFYLNIGCVSLSIIVWVVYSEFSGGFEAVELCCIFFMSNFVMCVFAFFHCKLHKSFSALSVGFDGFKVKVVELVKFIFPYSVVAFLTITIQWGAALLSGSWLNEEELGVLSIVIRVATFSIFGFLAINTYMSPRLSKLSCFNHKEILAVAGPFSLVSPFFCASFIVFFLLFGKFFLGLLGESYIQAYEYVLVVTLFWLGRVLLGPVDVILLMTGHVDVNKRNLIISGVVSMLLGVILISQYGLWGAIFALSFSRFILSVLNSFNVFKIYGLSFLAPSSLMYSVKELQGIYIKRLTRNG